MTVLKAFTGLFLSFMISTAAKADTVPDLVLTSGSKLRVEVKDGEATIHYRTFPVGGFDLGPIKVYAGKTASGGLVLSDVQLNEDGTGGYKSFKFYEYDLEGAPMNGLVLRTEDGETMIFDYLKRE